MGLGHAAGEARLADRADARLRRAHRRRGLQAGAGRQDGLDRRQAAAAARPACRRCGSTTRASRKAISTEFPGYYKTADAGFKDEDGYLFIMGRTDDIINVAGHRLSTGGMEEVLAAHPDVAECAVIGIADALKGEVPCGFIVLKAGVTRDVARSRRRSSRWCARRSGRSRPSSSPSRWRGCQDALGKILRGTMKKIADGETWTMPATIEDPKVLEEIGGALKGKGVGG